MGNHVPQVQRDLVEVTPETRHIVEDGAPHSAYWIDIEQAADDKLKVAWTDSVPPSGIIHRHCLR
jgi:hypothetical protein